MNRWSCVVSVVVSMLLTQLAWAGGTAGGPDITLPEPGTFELLALGGVVAAIIAIRRWHRK